MDWDAVASTVTALGVGVAAWQLRRSSQHARTYFEDDLSREYRELSRGIPVSAHLGEQLDDSAFEAAYPALFHYIDLSNQQVFLRKQGRVSKATWVQWNEGIRTTLAQPSFARAWGQVKAAGPDRFSELRCLESCQFSEDPRTWSD
jgi:hypothetical protein